MKKILHAIIFPGLLITAVSITAFTHQEKKNAKKEQQNPGKQDKPGKPDKVKDQGQGKEDKVKSNQGGGNQGQGRNDDKGRKDDKAAKDNRGPDDMDPGSDKAGKGKGRNAEYGYAWDRETFKDRKKIRNQEKVTICHKVNRDGDPGVTIRVSSNALKAHTDHGDVTGECPEVANSRFSDRFLRTRTDYYNVLQNGQEQVLYSQSILDYALLRLADARLQLQSPTLAPADLQRRQLVVVELEQNVSLLQTLVGAVANLVVNKLTD
ncbi:MAG TPA: hypothetical protein VFZ78_06070 [Flavisolibacter sp.]